MSKRTQSLVAALSVAGAISAMLLAQDASYQTKVYSKQGGDELVVASGGKINVESGGTLEVNGTALDTGELGVLNVTAGTVTASKAVVVDSNKDAGDFRNLDAVNFDAGASGTAGSLDIFPATAAKGKLTLACANQTGDTAVTWQADAMGQASTIHFADPGAAASYVAQSTAALTLAEVDVLDGVTAGTARANSAAVLGAQEDIDTIRFTDSPVFETPTVTESGVGAKNGAAITALEQGDGIVHKTYLTLSALSVDVTDTGGANGAQGNHKLYDFPAGAIQVLGASYNLTALAGAGGISDTAALVGSLGSTAAAADNSTLTTTEADFIASTTGTLVAGAGALALHGSLVATAFDGHTTALDVFLNVAVPDADVSATDTLQVDGTIEIYWLNLGDY